MASDGANLDHRVRPEHPTPADRHRIRRALDLLRRAACDRSRQDLPSPVSL